MSLDVHAVIARLARRSFGVVTRRQLLEAGLPSSTIASLVDRGLLLPLHRGVYRAAHVPATRETEVVAAVLAVGEDAVASHATAASLWGLADIRLAPPYHVTSPRRCQRALDGVVTHRADLDRLDRTTLRGIPVTMAPRTAIDLAGCLPGQDDVDDVVVDLVRLRRGAGPAIRGALARADGARGVGRVRQTLARFDEESAARLASYMENGFLRIFVGGGVPPTSVNTRIVDHGGLFVAKTDFGWEPPRVHVETDGMRFHALPSQKRADDARQNRIVLSDRIVLRYSYADLAEPERVLAEVRAALELGWRRLATAGA